MCIKTKMTWLLVIMIAALAVIVFFTSRPGKSSEFTPPEIKIANPAFYHLFSEEPFEMADTLHYFYNTFITRGVPISTGDFHIYMHYPVFRSEDTNTLKLVYWLDDYLFDLMDVYYEKQDLVRNRFWHNHPAHANYVLNSWLSHEDSSKMGCLYDSLTVQVVLNSELITFRIHSRGYWGGAHGGDYAVYQMFDRNYDEFELRNAVLPEKMAEFNQLILNEYNRNIKPWRDYDTRYRINPEYFAFIPEGIVAIYGGYAYAEGNPSMQIPKEKFIHLLKPQYHRIFDPPAKVEEEEWD